MEGSLEIKVGGEDICDIILEDCHFSFQGQSIHLPRIRLQKAIRDIGDIADIIIDYIRDHADELFRHIWNTFQKWLKDIQNRILKARTR